MNLLSTAEAAERIGVSVRTLNRMAEDGRIVPAAKAPGLRGGYLYDPAEVERVAADTGSRRQCTRCGIDTTSTGLCVDPEVSA